MEYRPEKREDHHIARVIIIAVIVNKSRTVAILKKNCQLSFRDFDSRTNEIMFYVCSPQNVWFGTILPLRKLPPPVLRPR